MFGSTAHLVSGKRAENLAASFLKKHGVKILSRNTAYPTGELDIVAEDHQSIIFVEVKYRRDASYGTASEMVSASKQKKLRNTALLWMQEHDPNMLKASRFDVIAISNKDHKQIDWIKNAF